MIFSRGFFILIFMNTTKKRELIACMGLLVITIIWGVAFVVVKNALEYIPVMYMLAFRFTIGTVVLALVFVRRLRNINKQIIIHSAVIGLCLFIAYAFQTYGCDYTTAGKNAFLTTIYMILVPFTMYIVCRQKPEIKNVCAALVAFWGIGLISLTEEFTIQLGDGLTLICGVFYALHITFIDKYAKDEDPILLAIGQLFFTALYSWALAPIMCGPITATMFNMDAVKGMLYLGIGSTAIAMCGQNVCQKYAPPGPASIIMSMEAVFGALSGFIFLNEVMTTRMIAGCILMFVAMIMVETDLTTGFFPDELIDSAYDIDYKKLYSEGIRGVIFDIDNTLVEHGYPADDRAIELLDNIDSIGMKVVFLSNNKEPRVRSFKEKALPSAQYIYKAGKPGKKGYIRAMELMETNLDSTIFVGDQLFTDVWGAKRCGMHNILTRPIDPHEEIQIIIKRRIEWIVLNKFKKTERYTQKPHEKSKNS